MIDQLETLRRLTEHPPSPPVPVAELRRRVESRRSRRIRGRGAVVSMVVVVVVAVILPLLSRSGARRVSVGAGPTPTTAKSTGRGVPYSTRLDYSIPAGWQTLFDRDDRLVVATQALSASDLALALLARSDVVFNTFPTTAVLVVVGFDPLSAKYGTGPDGKVIDPGPANDLGSEQILTGGVQARHGDIPSSILRIASYAGPAAPADRLQEARAIAQGIRLIATGDPSVPGPPPALGSTVGFPTGPLPVPDNGLPVVATVPVSGLTVTLRAKDNCAYLRLATAQQSFAGACATRPSGPTLTLAGNANRIEGPPPIPGTVAAPRSSTAIIFRVGPGVAAVTAHFAEGGTAIAILTADGWGIAAGQGRIFELTGVDDNGGPLAQVVVP